MNSSADCFVDASGSADCLKHASYLSIVFPCKVKHLTRGRTDLSGELSPRKVNDLLRQSLQRGALPGQRACFSSQAPSQFYNENKQPFIRLNLMHAPSFHIYPLYRYLCCRIAHPAVYAYSADTPILGLRLSRETATRAAFSKHQNRFPLPLYRL